MDKDVIKNKIESLIRCINRIQEKRPKDIEILEQDFDIQDIIVLNIERAVQISVDIGSHILSSCNISTPKTMSNVFVSLAEQKIIDTELANNLAKAVGFRNMAVHAYQKIDWDIVYHIINTDLKDFKQFIEEITKLL